MDFRTATRWSRSIISACLVVVALTQIAPPDAAAPVRAAETISDYRRHIAGDETAVAWYGERVAIVLDEDAAPADRDEGVMAEILGAFDAVFEAYDDATGRDPVLAAPLHGRIRIEVSDSVGGGLAHHGTLGIAVGTGFFDGLYTRYEQGTRTIDQVFFYEIARNYWMADMNPAIDYHTSKGPLDYGWWTVGFNNAMSIFLAESIEQIDDMHYFGRNGKQFADGMESNLNEYLAHPTRYDWENAWCVPLVPWRERTSVNDLMTGLLVRLHREHGGLPFIRRLYDEIPKRTPLESRDDYQGARDNFYEAASIAARTDLHDFFEADLRWALSADAKTRVRHALDNDGQR